MKNRLTRLGQILEAHVGKTVILALRSRDIAGRLSAINVEEGEVMLDCICGPDCTTETIIDLDEVVGVGYEKAKPPAKAPLYRWNQTGAQHTLISRHPLMTDEEIAAAETDGDYVPSLTQVLRGLPGVEGVVSLSRYEAEIEIAEAVADPLARQTVEMAVATWADDPARSEEIKKGTVAAEHTHDGFAGRERRSPLSGLFGGGDPFASLLSALLAGPPGRSR